MNENASKQLSHKKSNKKDATQETPQHDARLIHIFNIYKYTHSHIIHNKTMYTRHSTYST